MPTLPMTLHLLRETGNRFAISCAASSSAGPDGLYWHPGIYGGDWTTANDDLFSIRASNMAEMIDAFNSGIPTGFGIPIDERSDHSANPDGAYGWIKKLDIREIGGIPILYFGIEFTPMGKAKVDARELPFLSASFFVDGDPIAMYGGRSNFIYAAALTSRPLWYQQPGLSADGIAASAYMRIVPDKADAPNGGNNMTAEEARAAIEELLGKALTEEEWASMSDGIEDFEALVAEQKARAATTAAPDREDADNAGEEAPTAEEAPTTEEAPAAEEAPAGEAPAEQEAMPTAPPPAREPIVVAASATELDGLRSQIADLNAKVDALAPATKQAEQVSASAIQAIAQRERTEHERALRGEIKACAIGQNGEYLLAKSAQDILLALLMNPNEETATALFSHIKANNGLQAYRKGQAGASLMATQGLGIETRLASLDTDSARQFVAASMAAGVDFDVAYKDYLRHLNDGK